MLALLYPLWILRCNKMGHKSEPCAAACTVERVLNNLTTWQNYSPGIDYLSTQFPGLIFFCGFFNAVSEILNF